MAKPNQAQDQTMEEILASIRRIISDDEARVAAKPAPVQRETPRPISNVSHLFAEPTAPEPEANPDVVELQPGSVSADESAIISEAFAQAMEADDPVEETFTPPPRLVAPSMPSPRAVAPKPLLDSTLAPERKPGPPLLSPRTDAAVASAFTQLADTIFSGKSRTIDNLVEDMLRPMLKTWLDNNLPPLVERMVREEIDRVSRGRR
jgi:cell pole-organizing protein PopZ